MNAILERYGDLLREVDQWFAACLQSHANLINCRRGCSACCRGLFDITILDALYLRSGFDLLPADVQLGLRLKAGDRLDRLTSRWPSFTAPWILNNIPEPEWLEMMPEDDETPCLLLGKEGGCLVYEHRPMSCRLNGIPQYDMSGEALSDEWCTLNFAGIDPAQIEGIRHPFNELFAQELLLFRELTKSLFGIELNELDTIIPAALLLEVGMIRASGIIPAN
jgi:Fe-S-cluster containining protein